MQQSRKLASRKKLFMRSWDERVQEEMQILDTMLSQEVCTMCGIFGIIGRDNNFMSDLRILASHATQRGAILAA